MREIAAKAKSEQPMKLTYSEHGEVLLNRVRIGFAAWHLLAYGRAMTAEDEKILDDCLVLAVTVGGADSDDDVRRYVMTICTWLDPLDPEAVAASLRQKMLEAVELAGAKTEEEIQRYVAAVCNSLAGSLKTPPKKALRVQPGSMTLRRGASLNVFQVCIHARDDLVN